MNTSQTLYCALMVAAPIAVASFSSAVAAPKHDGAWRISLVTEQGWCGAHEWKIGVRGGRVTEVGSTGAVANGRIDPKGRVNLQVAKGSDVIQTSGVIGENTGSGSWVLPNRSCTGRWVASKA